MTQMFSSKRTMKSRKKGAMVKELWKSSVISFDILKATKRSSIKNSKVSVSTEGKILFDKVDEYIKKTYSSNKDIK